MLSIRHSWWFWLALTTASFVVACGEDTGSVEVRVVSDLVPEREAATVEVALYRGVVNESAASIGSTERVLRVSDPLTRGLWVVSFAGVPKGVYTLWVTLHRENGEILARRPLTATIEGDHSFTVALTADCARVECPSAGGNPSFIACLAGTCVDPRCSAETPEFCPPDFAFFCTNDTQCSPRTDCSTASCFEGICLQEGVQQDCGDGEFCSALSSCTPIVRPDDAPSDPEGICGDACTVSGDSCRYAYFTCEGGEPTCTAFGARPAGYPCANDGVCDTSGVCVTGSRDGGTPDADVDADVDAGVDAAVDASVPLDEGIAVDAAVDASVPPDEGVDASVTPCATGYLGIVETGCYDINECAYGGVCDVLTTCSNTPGDFTCTACPAGYVGTGKTGCDLENGCDENPCDALTVCNPTGVGTFTCSACPDGYLGTGEGGCFDVNECMYNVCDSLTTCTNTPGDFTCTACPTGYTGSGRTGCDDVDECDLGMAECDVDYFCENTPGTFACTPCASGFESGGGSVTECDDIDECAAGTDTCADNEHCANVVGGFVCFGIRSIVASDEQHTCALFDNGSVKCWGSNDDGQLGYGAGIEFLDAPPSRAIDLGRGRTARQVVAGRYFTCALLDDGSVKCWGDNGTGQLGIGTNVDIAVPGPAVNLGVGRTAKSISAGAVHTCALLDDDTIKCWGYNTWGQLGYGDQTTRNAPATAPVAFDGGHTAKQVLASGGHTCAVLDDDSVRCWGWNQYGQLGNGTSTDVYAPSPTAVAVGGSVVELAGGQIFTCAVLADETLKCWGHNAYGQLGLGDTTSRSTPAVAPVTMPAGRSFRTLVSGYNHNCAILDDRTISCWGYNANGQLGQNAPTNVSSPPTPLGFGSRFALAASASHAHVCVLLDNDTVTCWGDNSYGQLGFGDTTNRTTPTTTTVNLRGRGL